VGWGEAGPSRRWSAETLESCVTTLRNYLVPAIIGHDVYDIAGLHEKMNTEVAPGLDPGQPISKNAIDIAAHDLICRKLDIPLQNWLGTKRNDRVRIARLISVQTPEEGERATLQALSEGYEGLKVKVGHDPVHDAEIMRAVANVAGKAVVWPDANQGFTLSEAIVFSRLIEPLGITLFEQPIPMTDIYGMKKL